MYKITCISAIFLLVSGNAFAEAPKSGEQTQAWLNMQKEAAPTAKRPVPGEVATEIYERYKASFTHPIPDEFSRDGFVESEE